MEEIQLEVQIRTTQGSRKVNEMRRQGLIPGIVYGGKQKPTVIELDGRTYSKIMRQHRGEMVLFHLNVKDGDKKLRDYAAVIKEEQIHPVSDDVIHIDFNRISLTDEIEVKVPVLLKGDAAGVKQNGILQQSLFELDVMCLPTHIPGHIDIDVSALNIGDMLHVSDIKLSDNVKTKHDLKAVVCTVVAPKKEETESAAEAGPTEPEVTKEKKKEEPAGAAEAPKAADKTKAADKDKEKK